MSVGIADHYREFIS